jgi:hypothetical protein
MPLYAAWKRRSSEILSTFASAWERFTMLNRSAISFGLLGSALYQPICASFSIPILIADQKDLLAVHQ